MKKILFSLVLATSICSVNAQQPKEFGPMTIRAVSADTTLNTDTTSVVLAAIGSNVASIDAAAVLLSGTIGGKIFMYGRTGSNYNLLDSSATLTAAAPFKTFLFDKTKYTYYKDYKFEYRTTTTQTSYLLINGLRRPDEGQ